MKNLTKEAVEGLLDNAQEERKILFGKSLMISYRLSNGFVIIAHGSAASIDFFNKAVGEGVARKKAIAQLWELESYVSQLQRSGLITDHRDFEPNDLVPEVEAIE